MFFIILVDYQTINLISGTSNFDKSLINARKASYQFCIFNVDTLHDDHHRLE